MVATPSPISSAELGSGTALVGFLTKAGPTLKFLKQKMSSLMKSHPPLTENPTD